MRGISGHLSVRRFVLSSSALMSIALAVAPTAAFADCLPDVSGLFVTCQSTSALGYQTSTYGRHDHDQQRCHRRNRRWPQPAPVGRN